MSLHLSCQSELFSAR